MTFNPFDSDQKKIHPSGEEENYLDTTSIPQQDSLSDSNHNNHSDTRINIDTINESGIEMKTSKVDNKEEKTSIHNFSENLYEEDYDIYISKKEIVETDSEKIPCCTKSYWLSICSYFTPQAALVGLVYFVRMLIPTKETFQRLWYNLTRVYYPGEPFRLYWDVLLFIVLIYNVTAIPIRLAFVEEHKTMDILDTIVDSYFWCDILINFRTAYFHHGKPVIDSKKIALHYAKTGLTLDLITTINFDRIAAWIIAQRGSEEEMSNLPNLLRFIRVIRLVKLFRFVRLFRLVASWEDDADAQLARFVKFLKLFMSMIFMSHMLGCIFMYIAVIARETNNGWYSGSWIVYIGEQDSPTIRRYLLSLYWATTTLTSVGYGDITPKTNTELAWTVITEFIGSCIFAYIVGNISSLLSSSDAANIKYREKVKNVQEYMDHKYVPQELKDRIRKFYSYSWKRTAVYDEATILQDLPFYLRQELSMFLAEEMVASVPFLQSLGDEVVAMLVTRLRPLHLAPGEIIMKRGQIGLDMYFLQEGELIVEANGKELCRLTDGSYFGEAAIMSEKIVKRTVTVVACDYSDLYSLSRADFEEIKTMYPELITEFKRKDKLKQGISRRTLNGKVMQKQGKPAGKAQLNKDPSAGPIERRISNTPVEDDEHDDESLQAIMGILRGHGISRQSSDRLTELLSVSRKNSGINDSKAKEEIIGTANPLLRSEDSLKSFGTKRHTQNYAEKEIDSLKDMMVEMQFMLKAIHLEQQNYRRDNISSNGDSGLERRRSIIMKGMVDTDRDLHGN